MTKNVRFLLMGMGFFVLFDMMANYVYCIMNPEESWRIPFIIAACVVTYIFGCITTGFIK